ncbi:PIG-L family deacetylase [Zavarzinia compransoris]|uniref:Glycosyl transferase family 1 domain-containing protein n=1 Tax=Zavarzinia compransoris TaxID=1264899 RepID=A0A317E6T1_9PROT|nr:PIG-L family deacetylase [Zavarzinia compransoris]PWR21980.1 hypothetical protein DKG75_08350 [Zavarzinia compransoris]TDP47282.1 glycosyl transferase family 1 [Zavarzinia compransoris]
MSPGPEGRRARAVYFDVDSFSFEGFSNGATIQYREMLRRFQARGLDAAVVTVGQAAASPWAAEGTEAPAPRWHFDQGIAIGEYLLPADPATDPALYRRTIAGAVAAAAPDLAIVHTPPARLEEAELALFEVLAGTRAARLCFVPDSHFPAPGRTPPAMLARLAAALRAFTLVAPSRFIAEAVSAAGLGPCRVFANVFDRQAILARGRAGEFVTFINPHPMKGVEIFLDIARRLPHRRFQVIRTWPYPPVFTCDLPNVEVRPFSPAVAEVWRRAAVLIVPSLCPEGFGRIIVEAQLNGIPVIAHAGGGVPEAAGSDAFLIPPPATRGDPVFPEISAAERARSVAAFCTHIEAVFAGAGNRAAARAHARRWLRRGERDTARLVAPFARPGNRPPSLLVLAPHPDDAAFSVGGLVRAWRGPKTVLTVFGRSNFTRAGGFTAAEPVSHCRRQEDEAYCRRVGASLDALDLPEASLRRAPDWAAIFGRQPERYGACDRAARDALDARLGAVLATPPDLVLVPAALGDHADHLLVRDAALAGLRETGACFAFYEDLPYAADLAAPEIREAIAGLTPAPAVVHVPLGAGLAAKLDDAACYASQVDATVLEALERHARRWPAPAERLWGEGPLASLIARGLAPDPAAAP